MVWNLVWSVVWWAAVSAGACGNHCRYYRQSVPVLLATIAGTGNQCRYQSSLRALRNSSYFSVTDIACKDFAPPRAC